jgi:rhodanese-related sulfurtransferase
MSTCCTWSVHIFLPRTRPHTDPFLRLAKLTRFGEADSGTDTVLDIGGFQPAMQTRLRNPEILRNLSQRRLTLASDRDKITTNFRGKGFGMVTFPQQGRILTVQNCTKPTAVPSAGLSTFNNPPSRRSAAQIAQADSQATRTSTDTGPVVPVNTRGLVRDMMRAQAEARDRSAFARQFFRFFSLARVASCPRRSVWSMQPTHLESHGWMQVAHALNATRVLVVCREPGGVPASNAGDCGIAVVRTGVDPVDQQSAPFPMAYLESCLVDAPPEGQRAAIHQAVQHLEPGGSLAMSASLEPAFAALVSELDLRNGAQFPAGDAVVYQRGQRTTIHDLVWAARSIIDRVAAGALALELAGASPPLIVDTRTHTDRCRAGVIPGSIHVPRTVLEWHLDPTNGYRHPAVIGLDQPMVLVCNGGYSSSLAAANLVHLGFTDVRDLIGGMRAWLQHGHEVQPPDHAHLDF